MKKLVLALSFLFVLGLVSVNAQDKKKEVKKAPAKTEIVVPVKKDAVAPVKKDAKKKVVAKKKIATTAPKKEVAK